MKINDVHTYLIQIQGHVEEEDINQTSPLQLTIDRFEERSTTLVLRTDQSGLIGQIRHLHSLGLVLLSISRPIENLPVHEDMTIDDKQSSIKG